jgi:hypothetical protein
MTTLLIIVFFGHIFAAGFNWLMSVESTNTDEPKRKKSDVGEYTIYNPSTGLPMRGGVDSSGHLWGE